MKQELNFNLYFAS